MVAWVVIYRPHPRRSPLSRRSFHLSSHLSLLTVVHPLSLQPLTKCSSRNSFVFKTIHFDGGVCTGSVWQLCCLGEFLVISMIHLHSSEVVARCVLDFLCAGYSQRGLSRHMLVRFNAVVANANSAATFPSPRRRNRRMPRCSFKIPMTGSEF